MLSSLDLEAIQMASPAVPRLTAAVIVSMNPLSPKATALFDELSSVASVKFILASSPVDTHAAYSGSREESPFRQIRAGDWGWFRSRVDSLIARYPPRPIWTMHGKYWPPLPLIRSESIRGKLWPAGQRPVEWCVSVRSSTMSFMLGGLELKRDGLVELEGGDVVHGEVAAA